MDKLLKYKGYYTVIHYSAEDKVLYGKIEDIDDLVSFESESAEEIEKEFHDAVDDYLDFCGRMNKLPNKPFKGSFNVRIPPELHRALATMATTEGISMNQAVVKAIEQMLKSV